MPLSNDFQHAAYSRSDPGERVSYREFEPGAPPDSLAWQEAMARLGGELAKAGVRAVLFMHGTFLGTDLFGVQRLDEAGGLRRGYSRGIPGVDALLALMREDSNGLGKLSGGKTAPFADDEQTKKLIDDHAKDAGNFSTVYVEQLKKAINRNVSRPIACTRYLWSSEHHHLGRALASLQLISKLSTICAELTLGAGDRVLVQAHGQAGMVLALVSNLLAPGESSGRKMFLQRLKSYFEQTRATPEATTRLDTIEQLTSLL